MQQQQDTQDNERGPCHRNLVRPAPQVHQAGVFIHRFASPALERGVIRFERHVGPPGQHQHDEDRFQAVGRARIGNAHQNAPNDGVYQPLGVLAVVNSADSRDHAQKQSQAR